MVDCGGTGGFGLFVGADHGTVDVTNIRGDIDARCSWSTLHAQAVTGDLNVRSTSGNVRVAGIQGAVNVQATSPGSVTVENLQREADIEGFETDIVVSFAPEPSGFHVTAEASLGGSIRVDDLPLEVHEEQPIGT